MPEEMKTESLQPGRETPQPGAADEANAGLTGSAAWMEGQRQATVGQDGERTAGGGVASLGPEMGGGGVIPEIRVPAHIKTIAATPENFPDVDQNLLEKLRRKYPDGIPAIMGGQGGDSQEMLMNLLNAFQSEKPFEVSLTSARMRGVETSLALRLGSSAEASRRLTDKPILLPGLKEPLVLTELATVQQIVTTSPVAVDHWKGDLVQEIDSKLVEEAKRKGLLVREVQVSPTDIKYYLAVEADVEAPPQLIREFLVNDSDHPNEDPDNPPGAPKHKGRFVLAPLVPAKLERHIISADPTKLRSLSAVERSRRQVSNYFAMLNLTRGLAGSLSQHDMLGLQRTADRIMAGSHDETPVFKLIGMVPQVHAMLASDKIETLAQFYETHLTETKIFHAMRTTALAIGMQLENLANKNEVIEVSGTVALGDFMDQLLSSQGQMEKAMSSISDAGPRMGIRGLVKEYGDRGTVVEEGVLIWKVLLERLGRFDPQGNWQSLKNLLFEGKDLLDKDLSWDYISKRVKGEEGKLKVSRTNIPDVEVMMPLTKESLGVYPIEENIPAALYPLYLCAREFSRGLLLDLMMTPDFQGKAGKQVRKLRRTVYDVWTYWQARTGLNELQKTFPYKDFISEKLIPALIEKVKIEEIPDWKQTLKAEIKRKDGVWLEAFDQYDSYTKLAKDVIATVFTNPTLLPSRMPEVEGYITALALNNSSTTGSQKLGVYKKYLQDDFVSKGQMGMEEFNRRSGEFEKYFNYWQGGGPVSSQYNADMTSGRFPRGFTLEQWLKHRITNERYASRSQRPGTLRTKEEMKAAYATLTEAEKAVLDFSVGGRHLVKFAGTPDKPGITDSMGIDFSQTEGLLGLGELVEKFAWRNFPINFIPPRLVDGTSVGGYISDFVNLTNDTAKLIDGIGERKVQEKVTALPTTTENIDIGQMIGLAEKASEYILSTYHFVPYPHQRERALEALKVLLWATTPLKHDELAVATIRATPKGAGEPTHQEMFVPVKLFDPQDPELLLKKKEKKITPDELRQLQTQEQRFEEEIKWLMGNSMRGSGKGGRDGMIFLSDFPARFRTRFGDIKNGIFLDMVNMAKECRQSLTVVGMERPNYNTIPWSKTMMTLAKRLRQGSGLSERDMQELNRFAGEHLDPAHRDVSETGVQRVDRGVQDLLEILQVPFDLLSALLGGGK